MAEINQRFLVTNIYTDRDFINLEADEAAEQRQQQIAEAERQRQAFEAARAQAQQAHNQAMLNARDTITELNGFEQDSLNHCMPITKTVRKISDYFTRHLSQKSQGWTRIMEYTHDQLKEYILISYNETLAKVENNHHYNKIEAIFWVAAAIGAYTYIGSNILWMHWEYVLKDLIE